jgi:proteasome lid subunit RPN8/RPN11
MNEHMIHTAADRLRLPRAVTNLIFDHIRQHPGNEACGLIAARDGTPCRSLPIPNIAVDTADRYRMDPASLVRRLYELEAAGETLYAFYHSHPAGPAFPSSIDIDESTWPDTPYQIVSLGIRGVMEMRAFSLAGGRAEEIALEIS